jgi:hypothetical protein
MLEIAIGGLAEPPSASTRYTFCAAERETGLGFEMAAEGIVAALAIFQRLHSPIMPPSRTDELAACPPPLCRLFKFVDYSELRVGEGVWSYKAPPVDPVQLVLGLALAFRLERDVGRGWAVEVYSDAWPLFSDVLLMARPLSGTLRIYTSVYDQRAVVADRVVLAAPSISWDGLAAKREWRGGKMCAPRVHEPAPGVGQDVLELLRAAWEAGGFLPLKYAQERFGNAALRAVREGLVRLNTAASTLHLTEAGLHELARHAL